MGDRKIEAKQAPGNLTHNDVKEMTPHRLANIAATLLLGLQEREDSV
jgi:hypothetical protein